MINRLLKIADYNRNWFRYIFNHLFPPENNKILTFYLRNGQTVKIKAEARFLLNEIYLDRIYDIQGFDLKDCNTVLDLGANVGVFALYVASISPHATFFNFEPCSESYDMLKQNIRNNMVKARLFKKAVTSCAGVGYMSLNGISTAYAVQHECTTEGNFEQVECITLEDVFELSRVDAFDFVKIDIEGAEKQLLDNSRDELLRRLSAVVVEWHHSWGYLKIMAERFRSIGFSKTETVLVDGHIKLLKARLN